MAKDGGEKYVREQMEAMRQQREYDESRQRLEQINAQIREVKEQQRRALAAERAAAEEARRRERGK